MKRTVDGCPSFSHHSPFIRQLRVFIACVEVTQGCGQAFLNVLFVIILLNALFSPVVSGESTVKLWIFRVTLVYIDKGKNILFFISCCLNSLDVV